MSRSPLTHGTHTSGPCLKIRDLEVHFTGGFGSVRALAGVDLEVNGGEIVALIGESGSGKTTLARAVMGLTPTSRGSIEIDGQALDTLDRRALYDRVQMVFQDPRGSLDPRWTVGCSVADLLRLRGVSKAEADDRALATLELVGLDPGLGRRRPHALSGGQSQRVAIARALVVEPALLVADEAVAALDLSTRAQILERLEALRREKGLAILWIAHDLELVAAFADRVAILRRGELVETLPAHTLAEAQHPYSRALLASLPGHRPGSSRNRLLRESQGSQAQRSRSSRRPQSRS